MTWFCPIVVSAAAAAIGPFAIALEFAHVVAEDFARAQGGDQIVELARFFRVCLLIAWK